MNKRELNKAKKASAKRKRLIAKGKDVREDKLPKYGKKITAEEVWIAIEKGDPLPDASLWPEPRWSQYERRIGRPKKKKQDG